MPQAIMKVIKLDSSLEKTLNARVFYMLSWLQFFPSSSRIVFLFKQFNISHHRRNPGDATPKSYAGGVRILAGRPILTDAFHGIRNLLRGLAECYLKLDHDLSPP
jgi:hypothetical protein